MKRKDLIKKMESNGWKLIRHGGNHDVYGKDNQLEWIPRHREIKEQLAKHIIKKLGL